MLLRPILMANQTELEKRVVEEETNPDRARENAKSRPLREYHNNHVQKRDINKTELDLILLPLQEAKKGKVPLLYDTGSTISFIKIAHLRIMPW